MLLDSVFAIARVPFILVQAGFALFLLKNCLLMLKQVATTRPTNDMVAMVHPYIIEINTVFETVIFGAPDKIKISLNNICLVALLIVLLSIERAYTSFRR